MNTAKINRFLTVTAIACCLAVGGHAAQVTFSPKPPAVEANDIANLSGANTELNNVSDGDHDATYIADNRPAQGQTFTTGTNAAGYQLRAVTLRQVNHETYALVATLKYTVRVTKPAEAKLEVLAVESAEVAAATPGNFQTIAEGEGMGSGSGGFITFTFDKPVALKPNTTYGFDVGGGPTKHYWQTDGTVANDCSGGEAYSSGTAGVGRDTKTSRNGDRVFVVTFSAPSAAAVSQARAADNKAPGQ